MTRTASFSFQQRKLLQPVLDDLVFVGGCVTGLLITDETAPEVRATVDVDAIVEIASYSQYANFGQRLREIGFDEDTSEGAPLCRWKQGPVILDAMPLDEKILGFSNRWYAEAMGTAGTIQMCRRCGSARSRRPSFWLQK